MTIALALLLLAAAPDEDAAHRADRARTQALNARSWNGYAPGRAVPSQDQDAYDRARAEYRRRLADWRARVAACEAGQYDACE